MDSLPDDLLLLILRAAAGQCALPALQITGWNSCSRQSRLHGAQSGRFQHYAALLLVCKTWRRLMRDVLLPVIMLTLPESTSLAAEDATAWLAKEAPLSVRWLMRGQPRQRLFSAPHFRRTSGDMLGYIIDHNIRLPDDFGAAFPEVSHLQTVRRLPAGPLPPALEFLRVRCGERQRPADLSAVVPALSRLQELELEHTLFDQAWLPPSVARVSLRGCIVRRPFMETLRCSRKLFESFFVTALPGDRWRVTGEMGLKWGDGAKQPRLCRAPDDSDDPAEPSTDEEAHDGDADVAIPEAGASPSAQQSDTDSGSDNQFDDEHDDDEDEGSEYDFDRHEDYAEDSDNDSMVSTDRDEVFCRGTSGGW